MPRKTNKRTPKRNVSRKASKGKRVKRKSTRKSRKRKSKKVKQVLTSTYGLGHLMKVDEKGYKVQRVANKGPKVKKAKHPPIPSNIKGKKKKKKSLLSHQCKVKWIHFLQVLIRNHPRRRGPGLNM